MKNSIPQRWLRRLPLVIPLLKAKIIAEKAIQNIALLRASVTMEREEKCRAEAIRSAGPRSLHAFEHRVYSQNGEDGVIQEIFARIGAPTKTFIEIGVGDGGSVP